MQGRIWTPSSPLSHQPSGETRTVQAEVLEATFFRSSQNLVINFKLPDGKVVAVQQPLSRVYKKQIVSQEEAEHNMEVLAEMYCQRKFVNLAVPVEGE